MIITPSYNQSKTLGQDIESVLNQNYRDFEHILTDDGSNNNTVDLFNKYSHLKWIRKLIMGQQMILIEALALD